MIEIKIRINNFLKRHLIHIFHVQVEKVIETAENTKYCMNKSASSPYLPKFENKFLKLTKVGTVCSSHMIM